METDQEQTRLEHVEDVPDRRSDVETLVTAKWARWNFDADDDGLLVCRSDHPRSDACTMERLSPHEALKIINGLRAECLEWAARAKQLAKAL